MPTKTTEKYFSDRNVEHLLYIMHEKEPSLERIVKKMPIYRGFSKGAYEAVIGELLMIDRMQDIDDELFYLDFPEDRIIENGYLRMVPVFKDMKRVGGRIEIRYKRGGTQSEIDAVGLIMPKTGMHRDVVLACEAKSGRSASFSNSNFKKKIHGLRSFYKGAFAGLLHVTSDYRFSSSESDFEKDGGKIIVCNSISSTDIKDAAQQISGYAMTHKRRKKIN